MSVHLLGIRHHGPGSARHVLDTLRIIKPDILLVEGPPEGEAMLSWMAHEDMKPPVALLAYVPDNPKKAVFYPFAAFSPEWNAILYALENKIPVRFIDMPLTHSLASEDDADSDEKNAVSSAVTARVNPIGYLADIAGFDDAEEWWEHQFEIAHHPTDVFSAIGNAMESLRENPLRPTDDREAKREAFMRRAIRIAQKEMYSEIAVVCGAWHVPALQRMPSQKDDDALLKNLPKVKVETTWIPWTNDRLSFESGYGAGLESPGWYSHMWEHPDDRGTIWLSLTAQVFRRHQVEVSSAHIIESVRLANALSSLRNLKRPGLKELNESTLAVMCMGDPVFMQLIHRELIVGFEMGQIPEGTPQAPVQKDLEQLAKRLRLKISNQEKIVKLDLREDNDLARSILFHRLNILDVAWAKVQRSTGKGTFKEEWSLCWFPELTIKLLEKAPWGNTIEEGASNYLISKAATCTSLGEIAALVQSALPSDLQEAVEVTMKRMDVLAASTSDTSLLIDAFIPLAQVSRYGNVRKTDLDTVNVIIDSIFYRITAGLPASCTGIDDDQAETLAEKIKGLHQSLMLLDDAELKEGWVDTIQKIVALSQAAPMVQGYCCKILYDLKIMDSALTGIEFSRALSVNNSPEFSASWLEGFLKDAATQLILDDIIWHIVNEWLGGLDEIVFMQVVPLLRRTFSAFTNVEKRKLAQRALQGGGKTPAISSMTEIDIERAKQVLPLLEKLMGL